MENKNLMTLAEVPGYVEELTGASISRQTVYNWSTKGRKIRGTKVRVHLKVMLKIGQLFTTKMWVKEFLENIGE